MNIKTQAAASKKTGKYNNPKYLLSLKLQYKTIRITKQHNKPTLMESHQTRGDSTKRVPLNQWLWLCSITAFLRLC